ncbi:MAG: hypothetical protein JW999_04910 [Methanotrichaceae archaeon]|nr:hypothetical protein [Methanotrichaceae archaeon]
MQKLICLMVTAMALICSAKGGMPLSFAEAMNNAGQKDILTVKNYDAGASFTEAYTDIDHLERNTQVNTRAYGTESAPSFANIADADSQGISQAGGLEASINSNVIGKAHIAWQSFDPSTSDKGRHQLLGRSVEDLTGVFSIEKFIQLWSDSRPGEISVDWLPCS